MAVIGVDGCKGGWLVVHLMDRRSWKFQIHANITLLWESHRQATLALIDIPIGLRGNGPEERSCDLAARQVLGPRKSSVFPAPGRAVVELQEMTYQKANAKHREVAGGKGLSRQSYALLPKIREVDQLLRQEAPARRTIREVHPEVCFWGLAGGRPMQFPKKEGKGFAERRQILTAVYPPADRLISEGLQWLQGKGAGADDLLDALAAAVTAIWGQGRLATLPPHPERDAHGLPMEMVYFLPGKKETMIFI